jgi:hypothetical protein
MGTESANDERLVGRMNAAIASFLHISDPRQLVLPLMPSAARLRAVLGGITAYFEISGLHRAWQSHVPDTARFSVLRQLVDEETRLNKCVTVCTLVMSSVYNSKLSLRAIVYCGNMLRFSNHLEHYCMGPK